MYIYCALYVYIYDTSSRGIWCKLLTLHSTYHIAVVDRVQYNLYIKYLHILVDFFTENLVYFCRFPARKPLYLGRFFAKKGAYLGRFPSKPDDSVRSELSKICIPFIFDVDRSIAIQ